MTIAILCPSRGRLEGFQRMVKSSNQMVYAAMSREDFGVYPNYSDNHRAYIYPDNLPTVAKWNDLAQIALANPDNDLFMLGSDDMYFDTPGWDKALLDHYNALENKIHVYSLQDSRDKLGTPHPIVTREYILAMGYFLPPIFLHWFVDSWTVQIAKANNCFTHMKDYLLVHDKSSDTGNPDETFSRIRSWGWRERDGYVADKCGHFLELEKKRLYHTMNKDGLILVDKETMDRMSLVYVQGVPRYCSEDGRVYPQKASS